MSLINHLPLKIDYIKMKLLHSLKMSLEKCFQKHTYMYNFFLLILFIMYLCVLFIVPRSRNKDKYTVFKHIWALSTIA